MNSSSMLFTARFGSPNDCRPRKRHVWGTKAKPLGCVPPTALLFVRRLSGRCILTSIKEADCDPVVGIMNRVRKEGAVSWRTKATKIGWPFSSKPSCKQSGVALLS